MLDKYIKIEEKTIEVGQNSRGLWYCKNLPAKSTVELDILIGKVNEILNKYNIENEKDGDKKKTPSKKK